MREVLLFFFFIAVRCCSLFLSSSVLVGGVRVGEAGREERTDVKVEKERERSKRREGGRISRRSSTRCIGAT
jgi:hypothetical protein